MNQSTSVVSDRIIYTRGARTRVFREGTAIPLCTVTTVSDVFVHGDIRTSFSLRTLNRLPKHSLMHKLPFYQYLWWDIFG